MKFNLIRVHWPALVLAVLVGFLLVLPPLWAKIRWGIDFNDPINIRANDEFFYFARIRDVIDGYPFSGNPYIWEHKSDLSGQPVFLGEYLTAKAIKFLGRDVVAGSVLLDFILPPIAVLLTYFCLFAAVRLRWLSLAGAVFLFFYLFPHDFGRTVSPQLNFLFWLSQFLLLYLVAFENLNPRTRRLLVFLAAINFGLLFYIYTYYWTFYLAFLGIGFLIALLARARDYAVLIAKIAGGGLIVALPYFWMMSRVFFLPEYDETVRRIGMIDSHFPSGIAIIIPAFLLLAVTALLLYRGFIKWDIRVLFFSSGALAAVASVNQHVITGKNLEFSSHYYMLAMFWFVFYAAYLAAVFFQKNPHWAKLGAALALTAAAAAVSFALWDNIPPKLVLARGELRRYMPLFEWLRQNTKKDDAIYASLEISNLIPIYTADNVFFSSWVRISFMSDEELLDRYALNEFRRSVNDEAAVRNVFGVQYLNAALHIAQENKVRRLLGLESKSAIPLPAEAISRIRQRFGEVRKKDLYQELKRYRVDYAVWDRGREPHSEFEAQPIVEKLYDQGDFAVYRMP